ncbi:MAG: cytochrome c peroxidase [Bacteroidota bacterium]
MKRLSLTLLLAASLWACTSDVLPNPIDATLKNRLEYLSSNGSIDHFILPEANNYDAIPQDINNPLTEEKVALGKLLFYETGIARDPVHEEGLGTYSCATCHVPTAGFMPGRIQGIADGGLGFGQNGESRDQSPTYADGQMDVQGARPIGLLNVAFVSNTTWNGKFGANHNNVGTEAVWGVGDETTEVNHLGMSGLETQNLEGLDLHRMVIDDYVLDELGYRVLYDLAFPDFPVEERYSKMATSFAISAYLRTLLSTEAPFQNWLKGDIAALSDDEKAGAVLFYNKAGCYRCHQGAAMSANEFHALGVKDLYEAGGYQTGPEDKRNLGRGGFTGRAEDLYKFKVPSIYNMGESPFYFHGSSKRSLLALVEYFNEGVAENLNVPDEQLSPFFHPLNLTKEEVNQLVSFLDRGLTDPNLNRYVPEHVLSGNCIPNNDYTTKYDLGCE